MISLHHSSDSTDLRSDYMTIMTALQFGYTINRHSVSGWHRLCCIAKAVHTRQDRLRSSIRICLPRPAKGAGPLTMAAKVENSMDTSQSGDREDGVGDHREEGSMEQTVVEKSAGAIVRAPGVACIKPEFIRRQSSPSPPPAASNDRSSPQPPPAKKFKQKQRGQNKHRPRTKIPFSEQLCPSLHTETQTCRFGDKCRYRHDQAAYLADKLPDIGDHCYLFDKLGRCPYGLACRFGSSHISASHENITNVLVYDASRPQSAVRNGLGKELQEKLRKRKMSFPRSDEYLSQLNESGGKSVTSGESVTCDDVKLEKEESTKEDEAVVSNGDQEVVSVVSCLTDEGTVRMRPAERKQIDFRDKLYLAPLTTVGNLPFRRICKEFGADITCGEMAMCTELLQGKQSEWALVKRHKSEDIFGVQICGSFPDTMSRCAELLSTHIDVDFVDINCGCPIDLVFKKGAGSALMNRQNRFEKIVRGMAQALDCPLTVKMRAGVYNKNWNAHTLAPKLREWGVQLVTVHGRSREQRYTKQADWDYIGQCAQAVSPLPLFGNGDVLSYEEYNQRREETGVAGIMIARGALIKPWIFTEIKEQRHWDISSEERLEMLKRFVHYGLEHWGSDTQGVETTRRFLLEWLSFLRRFIPVGLLEYPPQRVNERPPCYVGRDHLETLMSSGNSADWVKISEMLLGPVPPQFTFLPKHKANSYS